MSDTLRTFLPLAWRNVWRNPRRTSITLIVVSVGLWSILFFNSFMIAWMQSSKDTALQILTGSGQIHAEGFMDDPNIDLVMEAPDEALVEALSGAQFSGWTRRLGLPAVILSEYKTLPVTMTGVVPAGESQVSVLPQKVVEGNYLASHEDDGVVIGLHLAEQLKTGVGRRVILMSQNVDGTMSERSFDVVGLFDSDQATEDFFAFTGLSAAQSFVGLQDQVTEIVFALQDDAPLEPTIDTLKEAAPELDVRSWKDLNLLLATTDAFMGSIIFIWLGVVFALMAIGIINTQLMAVFERMREFGLLRALGMRPRLVLLMVTLESALLIGIGVLIGAGLSALTIWSLSDGLDLSRWAQAMEMIQGGNVLYPDFHFGSFVLFSLIIWILGILVALWPARKASKYSPVEVMRRDT